MRANTKNPGVKISQTASAGCQSIVCVKTPVPYIYGPSPVPVSVHSCIPTQCGQQNARQRRPPLATCGFRQGLHSAVFDCTRGFSDAEAKRRDIDACVLGLVVFYRCRHRLKHHLRKAASCIPRSKAPQKEQTTSHIFVVGSAFMMRSHRTTTVDESLGRVR